MGSTSGVGVKPPGRRERPGNTGLETPLDAQWSLLLPGRTSAPLQVPCLLGYMHLSGHTWCGWLPFDAVQRPCLQIDPPEILQPWWCAGPSALPWWRWSGVTGAVPAGKLAHTRPFMAADDEAPRLGDMRLALAADRHPAARPFRAFGATVNATNGYAS